MTKDTVFLVGFFKFANNPEYGFKRIDLHGIFKTKEEALEQMSFCDEAGWYEGVLIEERRFGHQMNPQAKNRTFLIQQEDGSLKEVKEPEFFKNIVNLIG